MMVGRGGGGAGGLDTSAPTFARGRIVFSRGAEVSWRGAEVSLPKGAEVAGAEVVGAEVSNPQ